MAKQTETIISYPAADSTKLAGIEDSADANIGEEFTTGEQTKLVGIAPGAEVNPADLAALEPTAHTKLAGVEDGAKDDQTGSEMVTAIVAEPEADRKLVITDPVATEHKVYSVKRNAAGELDYDYEDVAEV